MSTTKAKSLNINSINETHLKCRIWGHSWSDFHSYVDGRRELVENLVCTRCESHREQIIPLIGKNRGFAARRRYTYAEGYQFKGTGRGGMSADARAKMRLRRARLLVPTPA